MRNLLVSGFVGALLGAVLTYRLMPPKTLTITKDKIVTQTQIQEKVVTKTINEPSGVVTVVEERTKVVEKQAEKLSVSHVPPLKAVPQYRATAQFSPTFEFVGAGAERRLLGPVWGGVSANRDREILFTISWEF